MRSFTTIIVAMVVLAALCISAQSARATEIATADDADSEQTVRLIQQYCADCHGTDAPEADLPLAALTPATLSEDAELARRLLHAIDTREMPPADESQPTQQERETMTSQLRSAMRTAVAKSDIARTPVRRMNRFQYNNAVVDLFDLKCIVFTLPERAMRVHRGYFDPASGKMPEKVSVGNRPLGKSQMIEPRLSGVAAFPQDLRAEHGYDTQADHLSLSPLLMEEFLKLGQSITQSPDFNSRSVGIWKDFFAAPSGDADIEELLDGRLRKLLTKAFRGPVDEETLQRYTRFAKAKLDSGASFPDTMKSVAAATIASPRFLYLFDKVTKENPSAKHVDDFELASRLSFFLWGSIPDDRLLSLAEAGQLSDRKVLNQQIDRMLKDKRLKRFCDSFPSQWLQLDRIISSVPNRETFPEFYFLKYRASMHMMLEPLLLFETVLIENLPITQLVDSDFTYRSRLLDRVYGELGDPKAKPSGAGVAVLNYRRTPVTDRRTGGVITNAAVMTMTSGPERTQPITRGAWIAGVIFNDPPEPPPADVPPLSEKPHPGEEDLTLRKRLAAHRERADCRGCHEQIDPLGFALENYDPIGRWRPQYDGGFDIDTSGKLFGQHTFRDIAQFKDAILLEKDRFTRALAGHLLAFALGRELGPADMLATEQITESVKADGYRMRTLIRHIILSKPFRTKSS